MKSVLRAYCVQLDRDWEEGLPWLLLAAREVVQESTGFSPNDLVIKFVGFWQCFKIQLKVQIHPKICFRMLMDFVKIDTSKTVGQC